MTLFPLPVAPSSRASRSERVDVCIVGSGAGGSVIAHEAAKRGLSTLVLERGPRVERQDMTLDELQMVPWLYKYGGMQQNRSMDLFILQGSCVGGSTVLSNMVMLRPEAKVFDAFARYGAEYDTASLDERFDQVATELEVAPAPPENVSGSTAAFVQGARDLGLSPSVMQKALGACPGCGYCNVGCTFGVKRDAAATYLRWAEAAGARVVAEAEVERVVMRRGVARGVVASVGRERRRLEVRARVVVVAAGAIASSALLMQSGICRNVGTRLSFNAGGMVTAELDRPLDAFDADQMTFYLDGPGYVIEATHNPPMSAALTTPGWFSEHALLMKRSRYLAYAGALVATLPSGRVRLSRTLGHEEVVFQMAEPDLARLRAGFAMIARVFFAAGARRVMLPTQRMVALRGLGELDRIARAVRGPKDATVGSAHPQGGNPISSDPALGAVDESLRVHGVDNLFVCDASVFPSCIGVNPIFTIMALAKLAAGDITAQA